MRSFTRIGIVTLAIAVAMAFVSSSAIAKGKGGKGAKGAKGMSGKVTAVDASSITIESKKQGSKVFKLTATTVYEKASSDPTQPATPATQADVKVGRSVKVAASGDQAQKVTIAGRKGGKGGGKKGKK